MIIFKIKNWIIRILITILNPIKLKGFKIFIIPKNDGMNLFIKRDFEPKAQEIFKKYIKQGDVVIDIGAYIGWHTLLMAKLVGETGKVYAFEADQRNFHYLQKNILANKFNNRVKLVWRAVSNETGRSRLFIDEKSSTNHSIVNSTGRRWTEIGQVKLDDFFWNQKISFIKIDAEGAEALI